MKCKGMKLILALIGLSAGVLFSQTDDVPANIAAVLTVKAAAFEKRLARGGDVSVYVLGAPDVAAELQKGIGKAIGRSVLKSVQSGTLLPAEKPSILFIGRNSKVDEAIAYTRSGKILSITGSPELVKKGVTLGFGVSGDGSPEILLNMTASIEEGVNWNPAILKVAKTMK